MNDKKLNKGYVLYDNVSIVDFIERVFFTEVYLLSNNHYLFLLLKVKKDDVLESKKNKYKFIENNDYVLIEVDNYSHELLYNIVNDITTLKGLDAIAGMTELKNTLINEIIKPFKNPNLYKKFKLTIPNTVLFFGPPGCGKTFIASKIAEELDYTFITVNPSTVATPYVHGAVSNISNVFNEAKKKAPAVLFIDEIDGLFPRREDLSPSSDTKKEEIDEFLLQMNNVKDTNILVIAATNVPWIIDDAIMRSGRMDKKIYIPLPDFEARKDMFLLSLLGRPYSKNIDLNKLSKLTEMYTNADIKLIVDLAAIEAVNTNADYITEKMIINAINKVKPSVSRELLLKFEDFLNKK